MKLIHLVAVEQVEVGDVLVLGATRYGVTSIEDEINGRDFRLGIHSAIRSATW